MWFDSFVTISKSWKSTYKLIVFLLLCVFNKVFVLTLWIDASICLIVSFESE